MSQRRRQRLNDEDGERIPPEPLAQELVSGGWSGGQIYYVELVNVMSHKHYRVDFCPHMNFVIGPNGAGKSAIMIGTALCLGAKVSLTNRFKKQSDVIRMEQPWAMARVGLVNIGENAWREKEYGGVITIERKITRAGASTLKFYGGGRRDGLELIDPGRSTTDELHTILDRFHIQPMNPCTILMQEKAREFLVTSNPKQIYTFWHDATLLSDIRNNITQTQDHIKLLRQRSERKRQQMPEMKRKLDEYKAEFEEMQARQSLAKRIRELQIQLAWVTVGGVERDMEQNKKIAASALESITKWEKKLLAAREKEDAEKVKADEARKHVDAAQVQHRQSEDKRRTAEEELKNRKREVTAAEFKVEHKKEEVSVLQRRVTRLEKEIADAASAGAGREVVQSLRKDKEAIEAEISTATENRRKADARVSEASKKEGEGLIAKDDADGTASGTAKRVQNAVRRLADLERSANPNRGPAVGNNNKTDVLKQLIQANINRFSRPPLGPVGELVRVRDSKYTDAVESCIRTALHRFLFHREEDANIFKQLCKAKNIQPPPVSVSAFLDEVHDVSKSSPALNRLTVLRALISENPVVTNHLIDNCSVEAALVCDTLEEGKALIFRNPLQNAKSAYTLTGQSARYEKGARNNTTMEYKAKTILSDVAEARRLALEERTVADREHQRAQSDRSDAEKILEGLKKEAFLARRELQQAESQVNRLRDRLEGVKRRLEDAENEVAVDVEEIRRNRELLVRQKEAATAEVAKAQAELDELRKSLQPFEAAARAARDAVGSLKERADELTKELAGGMTRLGLIEDEKLQAESTLGSLRTKRTEAEAAVARKEDEIAELKRKASEVGARPAEMTKMTAEELQRDIDQKSARARAEADGKLSPKEIVEQYEGAMAKHGVVIASLESLDNLEKQLSKMADARHKYYLQLRRNYATRLSLYFMKYISQRGYSGGLTFEHDEAKLSVDVDVDAHQSTEARRSVHTLSGGERMFSTVSFLLSLWMTNESPFYALDEFDVFMDALHRTQSLKLLSEHARSDGVLKQFVFISPQSEEGMPKGADVRSFRLNVPERGINQGVISQAE